MLRLRAFGGLALERDGRPLAGPASQRRRLGLLAYLAAADRAVPREKLIALLWPERDTERGRHSLSQLLYSLRADVGPDALIGGVDEVGLDRNRVGSDLADFAAALAGRDWEAAAALYRGPFLDGFFLHDAPELERWVDDERQRLARAAGEALEGLAVEASRRGDTGGWVAAWRRRAGLDPLDSRVALRLMESLAASGDRAGALRHARLHTELLESELGAMADPDVDAFATELRARVTPLPARAAAPVVLPAEPQPLPGLSSQAQPQSTPPEPQPKSLRPTRRFRLAAAAIAALAVGVLGVHGAMSSPGGVAPGGLPTVLLGGISGPDSGLVLGVREALRAELAADERVRLLPDSRSQETLRLMRIGSGMPPRSPLLLEMAQREGAHFAVAGAVTSVGSAFRLDVQAFDPATGVPFYSTWAEADRGADVVAVVARLGRQLAARLTGAPADTSLQALPAVTTASLPALRAYALAREAHARGDRPGALALGEGALAHDTLFPLAHHLVGDLLWFFDQQTHGEAHLSRAFEYSELLPLRERLIVRARYEQIVRDRPDSALALWQALRAAYPDEALGYEGMAWTLRSLEQFEWAAAAAATAMRVDPLARMPNANNRLYALLSAGDTAEALAFTASIGHIAPGHLREARYAAALMAGDVPAALAWVDSMIPRGAESQALRAYRRHMALLATGRREDAQAELEIMRVSEAHGQGFPRSLLLQSVAEGEAGRSSRAAELAREALDWTAAADLSPPAVARLAERAAITGAWVGDAALIEAAAALIERRDAGRGLRSYRSAREAVKGARAYADGRYREAAVMLHRARTATYFSRSVSTVALLEADALARAGETGSAAALYRALATYILPDGDWEPRPVFRAIAGTRLRTTTRD